MIEARLHTILEGRAAPLDVAVLADDVGGFDYPWVIKLDGTQADDPEQYILQTYGDQVRWQRAELHPDGEYIYRLVGFHEYVGPALLLCLVVDHETQEPLPGKAAIRWWPDADPLPDGIPSPASVWMSNGCIAYVKENGQADWGVGNGEGYDPETMTPICKVWVCTLDGPCDLFEGWGWIWGTEHQSLVPVFVRFKAGEEPKPENGDLAAVVAALDRIVAAIEKPRTIT